MISIYVQARDAVLAKIPQVGYEVHAIDAAISTTLALVEQEVRRRAEECNAAPFPFQPLAKAQQDGLIKLADFLRTQREAKT